MLVFAAQTTINCLLLSWIFLHNASASSVHEGQKSSRVEAGDCGRPTLFLMNGLLGSEMKGTHVPTPGSNMLCRPLLKPEVVWYNFYQMANMDCWADYMKLHYHSETNTFTNSSGTQLSPRTGGWPDGTQQYIVRSYYAVLFAHLKFQHGYIPGKDFFFAPYDWRLGLKELEEQAQYAQIAARVEAAVKQNCGRKAIIMAHSYAAIVMLNMLHDPRYKQWRQSYVQAFVPLGGPFGGSAAVSLSTQLSGDWVRLYPALANMLPPTLTSLGSLVPPGPFTKAMWKISRGMPSMAYLLAKATAVGGSQVVVVTPERNYTVAQQKRLLLDIGDFGAAAVIGDATARMEKLLQQGPVPGIRTFCLYGTQIKTPITLVYDQPLAVGRVMKRPRQVINVEGDGCVDLKSLRLCGRIAPEPNVVELDDPFIDHATLVSHPAALKALSGVLIKLGAPSYSR